MIASETIVVRGNEIGFTGALPPGTVARYGEWARWAMFRHPDNSLRGKLGSGVARAQHAALFADITYPSELRIESNLARVGRTSFELAHRFVRADDETLVALLRVTIVQLGPQGPTPVDPTLHELVTQSTMPPELTFDVASSGPVFEHAILARPSDQDQFRHVNQARYVDFADDVRWVAYAAGHAAGFEGPLGAYSVAYQREVRAGTTLLARLASDDAGVRLVSLHERDTGVETTRILLAPRRG